MPRPTAERLVRESDFLAALNSTKGTSTVASGGSFSIPAPASSGGTLSIYATSGGSWDSIWMGTYVAGTGRVDVTQIATDFTAPGNAIASVTTTGASLNITVTGAATGSTVTTRWVIRSV